MPINHPSFGKLDDGRIIIFDTTLRDGEQSPGFSMNLNEKIRMAEALTELGVDVLEAGLRHRLARRLRKRQDHRRNASASAPTARYRQPGPRRRAGRHARGRRAAVGQAQAHPHRHRHQRPAHEIQAAAGAAMRSSPPRSNSSSWPASTPTTSNGRPRTRPAATSISWRAAARPRSRPAPRRSTCPTPSATRCRRTWSGCTRKSATKVPGIETRHPVHAQSQRSRHGRRQYPGRDPGRRAAGGSPRSMASASGPATPRWRRS